MPTIEINEVNIHLIIIMYWYSLCINNKNTNIVKEIDDNFDFLILIFKNMLYIENDKITNSAPNLMIKQDRKTYVKYKKNEIDNYNMKFIDPFEIN